MDKFKSYIDSITSELSCSDSEKQELAEEFADHLHLLKEEYIEKGYIEDEAVNMAIQTFGENQKLGKELQKSMFPFRKVMKTILWVTFIVYSFLVIQSTLVDPFPIYSDHRSYNLIPFATLFDYIFYYDRFNLHPWFENLFGKFVFFMPFGCLIPLLFKNIKNVSHVLNISFLTGLTIEGLQYFTHTGIFDIDTVIQYTLGSILGYLFVSLLIKWKVLPRKYFTIN